MNSAPSRSLALQHTKLGDALEIRNGTIYSISVWDCHIRFWWPVCTKQLVTRLIINSTGVDEAQKGSYWPMLENSVACNCLQKPIAITNYIVFQMANYALRLQLVNTQTPVIIGWLYTETNPMQILGYAMKGNNRVHHIRLLKISSINSHLCFRWWA